MSQIPFLNMTQNAVAHSFINNVRFSPPQSGHFVSFSSPSHSLSICHPPSLSLSLSFFQLEAQRSQIVNLSGTYYFWLLTKAVSRQVLSLIGNNQRTVSCYKSMSTASSDSEVIFSWVLTPSHLLLSEDRTATQLMWERGSPGPQFMPQFLAPAYICSITPSRSWPVLCVLPMPYFNTLSLFPGNPYYISSHSSLK